MPKTELIFYRDERGQASVIEWLRELRRKDKKAYAKCVARIQVLAQLGHELRRPMADYLRDGIHELRIRHGHVNYRILYFFHGQAVAILAHGLTKEDEVPNADIERAIQRKEAFAKNPAKHSYAEDDQNA
ncbi:MAG: type II toxin-antitoxin system RelE/ParE family toxin [Planctomycetota bacterium]